MGSFFKSFRGNAVGFDRPVVSSRSKRDNTVELHEINANATLSIGVFHVFERGVSRKERASSTPDESAGEEAAGNGSHSERW